MPLVGSACPPVVAMLRPDVKVRGPFTYPAFTAFRSDTLTSPPTSRTVVKPASSVFSAKPMLRYA
jgi:hypothetical protein